MTAPHHPRHLTKSALRRWGRRLHLALALTFGLLLTLSGLTGAVLAWREELDTLLNPSLLSVPPAALPPAPALAHRVTQRLASDAAYGQPAMLMLPARAGQVAIAWYRQPGQAPERARQVMVDPATLRVTGERIWGAAGWSRAQWMPGLFHLHRYLLAGDTGKLVIGVSGLALLMLALAGLLLWWPKSTLGGWRAGLQVQRARLAASSHRTAGALLALPLAVMGFSGASFNLPQWVRPAVGAVAAVSAPEPPRNEPAAGRVRLPVQDAVQRAQRAFPTAQVTRVSLPARADAPYEVRLRQPDEPIAGATRVFIDAWSGALLGARNPLQARAGDRFLAWQFPLHSGQAFGLAGQLALTVLGIAPLAFLCTGVRLWRRRALRACGGSCR